MQNHVIYDFSYKKLLQDKAKHHTSAYTPQFVINSGIFTIPDYPPRSPDINIIENIWAIVKDNVRKRFPKTILELKNIVLDEFNKIT